MAGRIRSIKPEILEDEKTAGLSHSAWRLFVSMWLLADDHGALRGEVAWLEGQVFWATPGGAGGVDALIDELAAVNLILLYEVRRQRYIQIAGWLKHQRVDHPGKPRVPRPEDPGAWPIPVRHSDRVYFIRAENSRAVKIGLSWNPARRLADLQQGHHERLKLEAEAPGDRDLERRLHDAFASSRLSGEWFADSKELSEFIEHVAGGGDPREVSRMDTREPSRDKPRTLAPDLRPPISDLSFVPDESGTPVFDPEPESEPGPADIPEVAWTAADTLRGLVLKAQPTNALRRDPWDPDHRKGKRRKWANEFRLMFERDGRTSQELGDVLRFLFYGQSGDAQFVVQSPDALRKKWDRIATQMAKNRPPPAVRIAPRADDDYSRIPGMGDECQST